ncbi:hypothetical protein [Tropicimonas sp. IMCC6043]|uniref:hypothetical protein n=1 Tax=Tropicimonas sp. IMCC6043 TaxID=2510645 RepID=UPI00101BE4B3|nr:hypothetical protein [Tropicimonas sp. IMCC6043]RYH08886.1 hypothetical protein EU800_14210 [Tropicimonas sp. IMCC6043]
MTYDRRAIMTAAWTRHRSIGADALGRMTVVARRGRLANCLRMEWQAAKFAVEQAQPREPVSKAETIAARIVDLENRDRLGWAGIEELSNLRRTLFQTQREETAKLVPFRSIRLPIIIHGQRAA